MVKNSSDTVRYEVEGAVADVAEAAEGAVEEVVEEDKSRFGINSLIHRMTGAARASGGGGAAMPRREPGQATPAARQAPASSEDDEDMRMEIPAFLRRQAN